MDAALLTLRQSPLAHVQFKALAVLRLLVDKQGVYVWVSGVSGVEGVGGGMWEGVGWTIGEC